MLPDVGVDVQLALVVAHAGTDGGSVVGFDVVHHCAVIITHDIHNAFNAVIVPCAAFPFFPR